MVIAYQITLIKVYKSNTFVSLQIPNGIVLSTGATIKIENLEVYLASINGWTEIESYGVTGADQLDQLIWKGGTIIDQKNNIANLYFGIL